MEDDVLAMLDAGKSPNHGTIPGEQRLFTQRNSPATIPVAAVDFSPSCFVLKGHHHLSYALPRGQRIVRLPQITEGEAANGWHLDLVLVYPALQLRQIRLSGLNLFREKTPGLMMVNGWLRRSMMVNHEV